MAETVQILGLRELEQNLKLLGDQMRERGVKYMMSKAAVPMRDDARRRAPVLRAADPRRSAGTVQRAIQIWRHKDTRFAVTYYVGVRGLSKKAIKLFKQSNRRRKGSDNPNDPFYWRFVELGTVKRAAQPFLRPAFESKKLESSRVALVAGQDFIRRVAKRFKRIKR